MHLATTLAINCNFPARTLIQFCEGVSKVVVNINFSQLGDTIEKNDLVGGM